MAMLRWKALHSPKAKSTSIYGSAGTRSAEQLEACETYVTQLLANVTHHDISCYTDGSALGNPGPCGSGAFITHPSDHASCVDEVSLHVPLGTGSNNLGELWAIGIAFQYLLTLPNHIISNNIYIFSDSKYAVDILTRKSTYTTYTNIIDLIFTLLSTLTTRLSNPNNLHIHWVPGHVDLFGNERADEAAKKGARRSRSGHGVDTLDYIANGLFYH